MTTQATGMCDVCGKPGSVHLTEIRDGVKTSRSLCIEHAPPELRDKRPLGPHRTSAEAIAFLRQQLDAIDQHIADPAQRAELRAEIKTLIADIEAGRGRLDDAD